MKVEHRMDRRTARESHTTHPVQLRGEKNKRHLLVSLTVACIIESYTDQRGPVNGEDL